MHVRLMRLSVFGVCWLLLTTTISTAAPPKPPQRGSNKGGSPPAQPRKPRNTSNPWIAPLPPRSFNSGHPFQTVPRLAGRATSFMSDVYAGHGLPSNVFFSGPIFPPAFKRETIPGLAPALERRDFFDAFAYPAELWELQGILHPASRLGVFTPDAYMEDLLGIPGVIDPGLRSFLRRQDPLSRVLGPTQFRLYGVVNPHGILGSTRGGRFLPPVLQETFLLSQEFSGSFPGLYPRSSSFLDDPFGRLGISQRIPTGRALMGSVLMGRGGYPGLMGPSTGIPSIDRILMGQPGFPDPLGRRYRSPLEGGIFGRSFNRGIDPWGRQVFVPPRHHAPGWCGVS